MKNALRTLLILALFSSASCKKSDDDSTDLPPIDNGPTITTTIAGTVVDEQNNIMAGVTMRAGNRVASSDANGFFEFKNITVPKSRFYVRASRDGYFDAGMGAIPGNGRQLIRIRMVALGNPQYVSGTNGGTITGPTGAEVIFPSNAFQTTSGVPITGSVRVFLRHLSPGASDFAMLVPGGDLATKKAGGAIVPLISYGMTGVELRDAGGMELELVPGATAELRMPLAAAQVGSAPTTIPLLHFDDVTGLWIQEGNATRTGTEYVGTVSHFSWWNCDVITTYPVPTIAGKVLDCNGNAMPGITVTINNQYSATTNSQGVYGGWVPSGITVTAQVNNNMNSGLVLTSAPVSISIGPGLNVLPDIIVTCPAYVSATVTGCDQNPTPFYAWASWNNGNTIANFSQNGTIVVIAPTNQQVTLHICNGVTTVDSVLNTGSSGSVTTAGTIILCNTGGGPVCTGGIAQAIDVDGNIYGVVQIGTQCWMGQNLKTSRYRNGDTIPYLPPAPTVPDSVWNSHTDGVFTVIDNAVYGKLYNWYAVADPRGLCPTGWHVPDSAEMVTLYQFLGGSNVAGGSLKQIGTQQAGTGLWWAPNTGATNVSGFTGLPAGFRAGGTGGQGGTTYLWTSVDGNAVMGWSYKLFQSNAAFSGAGIGKDNGLSVRCLKD